MPLPHPHGTASGQIGNGFGVNVQIDLDDSPGTTGGRLIAVGEDGKSKNSNRGVWALSENVDYIYQNYTKDRTVPGFVTFTAADSDFYNLMTDVFVGLPDYSSDESIGLPLLFSVLDAHYATLQDPTIGGEVRVSSVRDTEDVGTVYKGGDSNGFYHEVRLGFSLVDAPTGDVLVADYAIPAATVVNIIFGAKGNYENLASDALLRVMINKTGVPAGVILQNGTRKMLADLDLGNYSLRRVYDVNGDLNQLALKDVLAPGDNFLSEPVYGTQLTAETTAGHTSILGKINSAVEGVAHSMPNRVVEKVGDIVFDGMYATVTIPAGNKYEIAGETFVTPADFVVQLPGDDQDYYVVVDHSASVPFLNFVSAATIASDLNADMLIVAFGNVNSTLPVFNSQSDLRTTGRHLNGRFEVFVGSDAQCDFTDLQQAVNFVYANSLCLVSANLHGWRPRLVLRGDVHVDDVAQTVHLPANTKFYWEIVGEGTGSGYALSKYVGQAVLWGADSADTMSIHAHGSTMHVKRVVFVPGGSTTTAYAIQSAGNTSDFSECSFTGVLFGSNFSNGVKQDEAYDGELSFRTCLFSSITDTAIYTFGKTVLEDCTFSNISSSGGWSNTFGGGGSITRCVFSTPSMSFIGLGIEPPAGEDAAFVVEHSDFDGVGLILTYPGFTTTGQYTIANNAFKNMTFAGAAAITGDNSTGSHTSGESRIGSTKIEIIGNTFLGCLVSIKFDMAQVEADVSNLIIRSNNIRQTFNEDDTMDFGMVLHSCGHVTVVDNTITGCATGLTIDGFAHGTIKDNHFYNCTTRSVDIGSGPFAISVEGNTQTNDTVNCTTFMRVVSHPGCSFVRNTISMGDGFSLATAFDVESSDNTLLRDNTVCYTTNNTIYVLTSKGTRVLFNTMNGSGGTNSSIYLVDSSGYRICDNTISPSDDVTPIPGGGIYVTASTEPQICHGVISGNRLTLVQGVGQFHGDGLYAVIYYDSAIGASPVGKTFVEHNVLDTCGYTGGDDDSAMVSIYCHGLCQTCYNEIINPQGSTAGRSTIQTGIWILAQAPYLWSSIVHGNQILINNAPGESGGIGWYSVFVGINMDQHGSLMGNTVVATNAVAGDVSESTRAGIKVASNRNVTDVGNITHNVEYLVNGNANQAQGITVGNIGVVSTDGNLTAHPTGNATGA